MIWTPPRPSSSWWQRRACLACRPAWETFTATTGMQTASSTSPMPPRRCSERLVRDASPSLRNKTTEGQKEPLDEHRPSSSSVLGCLQNAAKIHHHVLKVIGRWLVELLIREHERWRDSDDDGGSNQGLALTSSTSSD